VIDSLEGAVAGRADELMKCLYCMAVLLTILSEPKE
jgi:hypothetical protein